MGRWLGSKARGIFIIWNMYRQRVTSGKPEKGRRRNWIITDTHSLRPFSVVFLVFSTSQESPVPFLIQQVSFSWLQVEAGMKYESPVLWSPRNFDGLRDAKWNRRRRSWLNRNWNTKKGHERRVWLRYQFINSGGEISYPAVEFMKKGPRGYFWTSGAECFSEISTRGLLWNISFERKVINWSETGYISYSLQEWFVIVIRTCTENIDFQVKFEEIIEFIENTRRLHWQKLSQWNNFVFDI